MTIAGKTNTYHLDTKVRVNIPGKGTSITIYYTLTFSELLLPSVSIGDPEMIQPIFASLPCMCRSHVHGDSKMVMILSRSLFYTKIHPLPPM